MTTRLHDFLKRENEIGNITRQEAVSMVPPLFLDVQPNHRVIDMCAAPGSKTFQLLEMIHIDDKKGWLSNGLVVANDVDVQRCHLLIHQTKRMCSPNLIVTNHEAQHFPKLKKEMDTTHQLGNTLGNSSTPFTDSEYPENMEVDEQKGLVFDRVLCDVPCSGDGTIRKAPDIWKKWNAGIANGLHRLQVQITMRGVALLRIGGRLVYSTCSLNPVENEAVVGEVLRRSEGCLELLDVSSELPELKRRPGLKTWKVRDRGIWISSYQNVNKHRAGSVVPGMFPTGGQDQSGLENERLVFMKAHGEESPVENLEMGEDEDGEVAVLPLERCLRIVPHDQDTGGFFIAVFKKVAALKAEHELFSRGTPRKNAVDKKDELPKHVEGVDADKDGDVGERESMCNEYNERRDEAALSRKLEKETAENNIDGEQSSETEKMNTSREVRIGTEPNRRAHQQGRWKGVDPVLFLEDEALMNSIISFYGIQETFPLHGHLVTRSEDTSRLKRIYYVSNSVTNVMRMNFRAGEPIKITSLGLKIFERQGGKEELSQCAFRIASEGLPLLLPHLTRQLIRACKEDFKLLLSLKKTPFTAFSDGGFIEALEALTPGCCVVILDDGQSDAQNGCGSSTAIGCWRGRANLSLLVPKEEAAQLLARLFDVETDDVQSSKADAKASSTENDVGAAENCMDMENPSMASDAACEQEPLAIEAADDGTKMENRSMASDAACGQEPRTIGAANNCMDMENPSVASDAAREQEPQAIAFDEGPKE